MQTSEHFIKHDTMTQIIEMKSMIKDMPTNIEGIVKIVQNTLLHQHWAKQYGIELNDQKEVYAEQPPSLMVRIQNTQNERELNELLPEIRSRHADIQPKLMDLVKKRRFELENQGSQVAS